MEYDRSFYEDHKPMPRDEDGRADWHECREEHELFAVQLWLDRAPAAEIVRVWNVVAWDTQEAIDVADMLIAAAFDPHRIESAKTLATGKMSWFLADRYEEWVAATELKSLRAS